MYYFYVKYSQKIKKKVVCCVCVCTRACVRARGSSGTSTFAQFTSNGPGAKQGQTSHPLTHTRTHSIHGQMTLPFVRGSGFCRDRWGGREGEEEEEGEERESKEEEEEV